MPAEISVILPTLNSAATLPMVLQSLMEGLVAGLICEVIVTDGGSTDPTRRIAEEAGAQWLSGPASRGGQLRRGCAQARGEWLLILHSDTELEPGWARVVSDHLAGARRAATFRLSFRAQGLAPRWVAGWANLRTRLFALPYGDQGLLIPRTAYEAAGGYPDQPLMEDVALIRHLSHRPALLSARAITGAERYLRDGWFRRGGRNLLTLARYFCGADPAVLARAYHRHRGS